MSTAKYLGKENDLDKMNFLTPPVRLKIEKAFYQQILYMEG